MVRGRRVRAVVACARNDECCSPDAKRKDRGVVEANNILTTPTKTQTITQFFEVVGVDFPVSVVDKILNGKNVPEKELHDLDDKEKEEFKEIITTPNMKNLIRASILSPPTPHRIEFCTEDEEKTEEIEKVVKEEIAPPKKTAKPRRLNNNQTANVQAANKQIKTANHKLTEYFPVRRSVRKVSKIVMQEKQRTLELTLRKGIETGLQVCTFDGKGRGVVANKVFHRGDFVVEYAGDLIDIASAKLREQKYAQDQNAGCYMYYFKHKGQQYCIDATPESDRIGRLVNHSRNGNLITRTIDLDNKPRLVLIAKDTIEIGDEITYDYGDRSKESLKHHPWLAY